MSFGIIETEINHLSANKSLDNILLDSKSLLSSLKALESQLSATPDKDRDAQLPQQVKKLVTGFSDKTLKNEKSINKTIKNYSSKINKVFTADLTSIYKYDRVCINTPYDKSLLDRAVTMELLRNGRFDIIESYENDRGFLIPVEFVEKFRELSEILVSMKHDHDFSPAINWATENSRNLKLLGSNLEFSLHKFQYLKLIETHQDELYTPFDYAKQNFNRFTGTHLDMISNLLLKLTQTKNHATQANELNIDELMEQFNNDYCKSLGLPSKNSPLFNTLLAGFKSINSFIKYNKISSSNLNWTTINELPFEIELPDELKFHSVFICPIIKEETTTLNPPMVLLCHHIISKDSVNRLSKNNLTTFKCPYCPSTTTSSKATPATFMSI